MNSIFLIKFKEEIDFREVDRALFNIVLYNKVKYKDDTFILSMNGKTYDYPEHIEFFDKLPQFTVATNEYRASVMKYCLGSNLSIKDFNPELDIWIQQQEDEVDIYLTSLEQ